MIAQFTLIPLGTKSDSVSGVLARTMKNVVESGLPYKTGAMGTTVEGEWYEIINLINRCRKSILRECKRVEIAILIDDRPDARGRLEGKVKSLERKMGLKLKK